MKISGIDVEATIERTRVELAQSSEVSPGLRSAIEVLLLLVSVLFQRLGLNSKNSNKPSSADPYRKPMSLRTRSGKKPGGQRGHIGTSLRKVPEPDEVIEHRVFTCSKCLRDLADRSDEGGIESRQVFDIEVNVRVTEHRVEQKTCSCGCENRAAFPVGVEKAVQYGASVKAFAVYLSQYQLLPYKRIEEMFSDQFGLLLSAGSIVNFNQEAAERLHGFEDRAKLELIKSPVLHADETGVRIEKKTMWLHGASNDRWTLLFPHKLRGSEAMEDIGIMPGYQGTIVHDHWKAYFKLDRARHALCNAHHLRELEQVVQFDHQTWANQMKDLLVEINETKHQKGSVALSDQIAFQKRYRTILTKGEAECPYAEKRKGQRGRTKKSKARNLLERLQNFEEETLRFMREPRVPFTNNQSERDIRMFKVQQKISGSFRSMDGARVFCKIRSFCSTVRKHEASVYEAIARLMRENRWELAE